MLLFQNHHDDEDQDDLVPIDPPAAVVENEDEDLVVVVEEEGNNLERPAQHARSRDPDGYQFSETGGPRRNSPENTSWFADIVGFRDFFVSAWSDGCTNMYCCGDDGCTNPCSASGSRVAPIDASGVYARSRAGSSSYGHMMDDLGKSSSYDSSHHRRGRRRTKKKPLAVAVGFHNYAKDFDSRPIVITPGHRRVPIDLTGGTAAVDAPPCPETLSRNMRSISSGIVADPTPEPEKPVLPPNSGETSFFQQIFSF